eukprot:TRINITY_DN2676_c0_g1_i1.p1 TRINITY_DN2676_c0_g1~~TRINITY_DN2676_c0_g1_i1.p1  ORF type:complete len:208 (+),score=43.81 TRINITY_DN2676_c0_g1_i1:97-720(+)
MLSGWVFVVLLCCCLSSVIKADERTDAKKLDDKFKVHITQLKNLAFEKGKLTTARRGSPIPQLQCIGGSAKGTKYEPHKIRCENIGQDKPQWECHTEIQMDNVAIGSVAVSCEGYDSPKDSFVLKGSCGLDYTLEFIQGSPDLQAQMNSNFKFMIMWDPAAPTSQAVPFWGWLLGVIVLILVVVLFFGPMISGRPSPFSKPKRTRVD